MDPEARQVSLKQLESLPFSSPPIFNHLSQPYNMIVTGFRSAGGIPPRSAVDAILGRQALFHTIKRLPCLELMFADCILFCSALKTKAEAAHPEEYRRASKKYAFQDDDY